MKEALSLIYTMLILPLVEAINANTAAVSGKATAPATPGDAAEEEVKKRGRKPAAAADKSSAEVPTVSAEDIIAHAKSLPDDAKAKLKAWMEKTFSVQSVSELKDTDRPAVLKMLKDKGATDTREQAAPAADNW